MRRNKSPKKERSREFFLKDYWVYMWLGSDRLYIPEGHILPFYARTRRDLKLAHEGIPGFDPGMLEPTLVWINLSIKVI